MANNNEWVKQLDDMRASAIELSGQMPNILMRVQREATKRAIEEAAKKTPNPGDGKARGAGMITGTLQSHWAQDSKTEPEVEGNRYTTTLENKASYAEKRQGSVKGIRVETGRTIYYARYVDEGHKVDEHFVPGLISSGGGLQKLPLDDHYLYDGHKVGGIVVGRKTKYVKPVGMTDAAQKAWEATIDTELDRELSKFTKGE